MARNDLAHKEKTRILDFDRFHHNFGIFLNNGHGNGVAVSPEPDHVAASSAFHGEAEPAVCQIPAGQPGLEAPEGARDDRGKSR